MTGNALAVVHDADDLGPEAMLAFARETRLSETTFVQRATVVGADYRNRIWTVGEELPFAGHPSLGTAVAVAAASRVTSEVRYVQQTGAGLQAIEVAMNEAGPARASMIQEPAVFGDELRGVAASDALAALGLGPSAARDDLPPQVVSTGLPHLMLPLAALEDLATITPDYNAIHRVVEPLGAFGIYAAVYDDANAVARTRFFARDPGTGEDPATGSAGGPLSAYLSQRVGISAIDITQGVEMGRRSLLRTEVVDDRVRVGGDVVVVISGTVRF